MRDFAAQLRERGVEVSLVSVAGGHGMALRDDRAQAAVGAFVAQHSRR